MKDKIIKFITSPFAWHSAAALVGAFLAGCFAEQGKDILVLIWTLISAMVIFLAYRYKDA